MNNIFNVKNFQKLVEDFESYINELEKNNWFMYTPMGKNLPKVQYLAILKEDIKNDIRTGINLAANTKSLKDEADKIFQDLDELNRNPTSIEISRNKERTESKLIEIIKKIKLLSYKEKQIFKRIEKRERFRRELQDLIIPNEKAVNDHIYELRNDMYNLRLIFGMDIDQLTQKSDLIEKLLSKIRNELGRKDPQQISSVELEKIKAELKKCFDDKTNLDNELNETKKQLEKSSLSLIQQANLTKRLQSKIKKLEEYKIKFENLEKEFNFSKKKIDSLSKELEDSKRNWDLCEKSKNESKSDFDKNIKILQEKIDKFEKKGIGIENEYKKKIELLDKNQNELKEKLKDCNKALSENNENLIKCKEEKNEEKKKLDETIQELKIKFDEQNKSKLIDLEKENLECDLKKLEFKDQIEKFEEQIKENEIKCKNIENELTKQTKKLKLKELELEDKNRRLKVAETSIDSLVKISKQEHDYEEEYRNKVINLSKENNYLKEEIYNDKKLIKKKEEEIDNNKEELLKVKNKNLELQRNINNIKTISGIDFNRRYEKELDFNEYIRQQLLKLYETKKEQKKIEEVEKAKKEFIEEQNKFYLLQKYLERKNLEISNLESNNKDLKIKNLETNKKCNEYKEMYDKIIKEPTTITVTKLLDINKKLQLKKSELKKIKTEIIKKDNEITLLKQKLIDLEQERIKLIDEKYEEIKKNKLKIEELENAIEKGKISRKTLIKNKNEKIKNLQSEIDLLKKK